jgi:sec-independent protein translocase protein TatC
MSSPPPDLGPVLAGDDEFAEAGERSDDDRSRMSFLEHLDELRRRLLYSTYAILASGVVVFWFIERLYAYLTHYFAQFGGKLIFTGMTEGFMFEMKMGLLAAVILASPFVFTQVWLFVAPGLYAKEKRLALPFVVCSTALFLSGAWFCHRYAFPSMFLFFATFQNENVSFFPTIKEVFGFYVKMVLGFGLVFQMPVLVFVLSRFGIVTARFMLKQFKYAVLVIFILAAVVTPSGDPVNQTMFAAPMIVLYLISIGVAWLFGKKRKSGGDEA